MTLLILVSVIFTLFLALDLHVCFSINKNFSTNAFEHIMTVMDHFVKDLSLYVTIYQSTV